MHAADRAATERGHGAAGAAIPVVEQVPVRIDAGTRRALARLASRIRSEDPRLRATSRFAPAARAGLNPSVSSLLVHDLEPVMAPIELPWTVSEYRALLMAGPGDAVAIWTPRVPAFEAYCRDVLRIGPIEVLRPTAPLDPATCLAASFRRDPALVRRMAVRAAARGGLNVRPYVGSVAVWSLAAAIGRQARVPVTVTAPPPALTRRVNDKLWFAARVTELLGERSLPTTASADSPEVLASLLRALAREHDRIGIKLPHASAGIGNAVIDAAPLRAMSTEKLAADLERLVSRLGWSRPYPILVSVWESPIPVTPSVQLWVPRPRTGGPIVEGVFEQRTMGPTGTFVGAAPARLPSRWSERLAGEAVLLATLFQELGYYGRCSFDAILVGPGLGNAELHWVECNGRWGGTSIPMTAVNRLTGDWSRNPFIIVYDGPQAPFADVLDMTADRLFRPGRGHGIVFLTPGDPAEDRGVDLLAIGRSLAEAKREAREAAAALS